MEGKGDNICATSLAALPDEDIFYYVSVKGSLHASDCSGFGLGTEEKKAIAQKFPGSSEDIVNGLQIKTNVMNAINALSQLGYKVICSTGEAEITWTLQREL